MRHLFFIMFQMEQLLPAESGTYLKIILGNVNVSILDKKARYDYKDQYEQFKLIVNLIGFVLSCTNLYIQYRVLDLLFMFLIVWYYCTLTIRESILRVNGSRIKVRIQYSQLFLPSSIPSQVLSKVPGRGGEEATESLVDCSHGAFLPLKDACSAYLISLLDLRPQMA